MKYWKYVSLYDYNEPKRLTNIRVVSNIIGFLIIPIVFMFISIIVVNDFERGVKLGGLLTAVIFLCLVPLLDLSMLGKLGRIICAFFCGILSYPFRYMKVRSLIKSGKCFDRYDGGTILRHYVYNAKYENCWDDIKFGHKKFAHKWKGDTCERCGKTKDTVINERVRPQCNHKWKGCTCRRCGEVRNHEWKGCICRRCGKERHGWRVTRDGGAFFYDDLRCERCGAIDIGQYNYLNYPM